MSWELTDCSLPDEKERVQVTYLKNNKEYCDVFAVLVDNEWYTEDADGSIVPFKYKVIAWQYPCSPFPLEEFDKNRFEMNIEHFEQYIQHEEIYEGYRSYNLFGCHTDDILYIAKPTTQIGIKAINELYLYKNYESIYGSIYDTDYKPPLTKEDIGSLIVVVCELGDLRNCECIRIERYDKAIQEITEELNEYKNKFI
jgi:hypothetical protein